MVQCVCVCVCQVSKVRRAGLDAETASLLAIIAGSHPSAGGLALVPPPRLHDTDRMCHHRYLEDPGAAGQFHNHSIRNRIKPEQNKTECSDATCIPSEDRKQFWL